MMVAIDGSAWTHQTGFGRYVRELTRALASTPGGLQLRLVAAGPIDAASLPPGVGLIDIATRAAEPIRPDATRSAVSLYGATRHWASVAADVIWFPSVLGYVPVLQRVPVVIGVHDTIGHRYPRDTFGGGAAALGWRLKTRMALAQATRVVTVSAHAHRRIREDRGVAPSVLRTVGEAPAAVFSRVPPDEAHARLAPLAVRLGLGDLQRRPVVVCHGRLAPHKNLPRLIEAFGAATQPPGMADAVLVLVGTAPRDPDATHRQLARHAQHHAPGRVVPTGSLDDLTLRDLLSIARVAVLPSLEEGYGLSAVEAAACGAPVVATRCSAMPEVLGDAALLIDPLDTAALAEAMAALLRNDALRATLRERAAARLASVTWAHAAGELAAVLREATTRC